MGRLDHPLARFRKSVGNADDAFDASQSVEPASHAGNHAKTQKRDLKSPHYTDLLETSQSMSQCNVKTGQRALKSPAYDDLLEDPEDRSSFHAKPGQRPMKRPAYDDLLEDPEDRPDFHAKVGKRDLKAGKSHDGWSMPETVEDMDPDIDYDVSLRRERPVTYNVPQGESETTQSSSTTADEEELPIEEVIAAQKKIEEMRGVDQSEDYVPDLEEAARKRRAKRRRKRSSRRSSRRSRSSRSRDRGRESRCKDHVIDMPSDTYPHGPPQNNTTPCCIISIVSAVVVLLILIIVVWKCCKSTPAVTQDYHAWDHHQEPYRYDFDERTNLYAPGRA